MIQSLTSSIGVLSDPDALVFGMLVMIFETSSVVNSICAMFPLVSRCFLIVPLSPLCANFFKCAFSSCIAGRLVCVFGLHILLFASRVNFSMSLIGSILILLQ